MKEPLPFGPFDALGNRGSTMRPDATHSLGIKPHPEGIIQSLLHARHSAGLKRHPSGIAQSLLNAKSSPSEGKSPALDFVHAMLQAEDDRPLIDQLHEATFTEPIGLQWIKDKYGLRTIIRKAHCFTLDDATSAMVGDFSVAVVQDLEAARQMAIPPFPVTWIDFNNHARLKRVQELGVRLTPTAQGQAAGPPVERVGWLIWEAGDLGGFYAAHCTHVAEGVMLSPLIYWWHCGPASTKTVSDQDDSFLQWLAFGVKTTKIHPADAYPTITPLHIDILRTVDADTAQIRELMTEIAGEMRHIWGFLIALGAGHLGAEARLSPQPLPDGKPPIMKNGKPLLPLEHKILHLHLGKKTTGEKLMTRAISHHHMRQHEVRGHWRQLKSGRRVPVKSHKRGDPALGVITKTYQVEK